MRGTPAPNADAWRSAIQVADVAASTKLVCYTIAQNLGDLEIVKVRIETLMREANLSRTSVKTHVRKAEAAGLLQVDEHTAGRGHVLSFRGIVPGAGALSAPEAPTQRAGAVSAPEAPTPSAGASSAPEAPRQFVIPAGDPRWHAWLGWRLANGESYRQIAALQVSKLPLVQASQWPPESPEIDVHPGLDLVRIPWGTPEYAAWLTHYRRTGRAHAAQSADMAQRTLIEHGRWPPVPPLALTESSHDPA